MVTKSQRYREILVVLARHGIGVADDHFIKHEAGDRARAEHLRRACEELGTLFIKLGQVLSTRGDLLHDAYRTELAKLQDEVVPLPATAIAEVIREDLGAPPDQLFAFFDLKPMGSASIGQVHAARLRDGRDVVLKVRKPGVDELVPIDLAILAGLIEEWSPRFPVLDHYDARGLLREFGDALRAELDYGREAANVRFFRDAFANEHGFTLPDVIDEYSKKRVLTEERAQGRKASEVADLPKRHRAVAARRIARFVLEPAFERGVFYADPHPGNLLIQEDGSLSVIDFGKVGRLTPDTRRRVADMFVAIVRSDAQRLADRLIEVTAPDHPVDRDAMTRELDRMLALYVDVSLDHMRFGDAISELLRLVRRHDLRAPGTLVQFFKALAMCEGVLQAIDPDSSFTDYLQPMIRKLVYQTTAGPQLLGRLRDSAVDAAELSLELPRRIDRVLGEIERGNLRVWTRVEDVEPILKRVEHLVARSNATILAAACIVGLTIVMLFYRPHGWQGWIGAVFWIAIGAVVIDYVRTLLTLRK
jgi:ubiquinone biosynthesis protein